MFFKEALDRMMVAATLKKRVTILLILVIAGVVLGTVYITSRTPKPTSPASDVGQTENHDRGDTDEGSDQDSEPGTSPIPGTSPPPESPSPTSPTPGTSSPSSKKQIIPILSALAYDNTAQKVIATGFVEGQFNATCTITFEKAGYSSVVRSGPTELQSNRSVCPRFEIPKGDFPAAGDWTAMLRIHSDSVEGTSDPGMVTIT